MIVVISHQKRHHTASQWPATASERQRSPSAIASSLSRCWWWWSGRQLSAGVSWSLGDIGHLLFRPLLASDRQPSLLASLTSCLMAGVRWPSTRAPFLTNPVPMVSWFPDFIVPRLPGSLLPLFPAFPGSICSWFPCFLVTWFHGFLVPCFLGSLVP